MSRTVSPAPGTVRRTQQGTMTIATGQTSGTATISAVNTNRYHLSMRGWGTDQASAPQGSQECPRLTLTDATTITARRQSGGVSVVTIDWELIDYH